MISTVAIDGFQSLARVRVDLGQLTVLSGPSNTGKSAFVRALRVLASNARGDWYVREGSAGSTVEANVSTDSRVVRVTFARTKAVSYRVDDKLLTAVGTSVPDEVTDALRIDPDLQIVDQFDPPFLLALPPSAVAKTFGALTNAHRLQSAVAHANKRHRDHGSAAKALTAQHSDALDDHDVRFSWYDDAARLMRDLYPIRQDLARLDDALTALRSVTSRVQALEAVASWDTPAEVPQLFELFQALDRDQALCGDLRRAAQAVAHYQEVLRTVETDIRDLRSEVARLEEDLAAVPVCPECGQVLRV